VADYLIRRLAILAATLLFTAVMIFLVLEVLPGDPASIILGLDADQAALEALRLKLGLDGPAPLRFLGWFGDFVAGDLGTSYAFQIPVWQLVQERAAVTVPLALLASLLALALSLPAGLFAAINRNRVGDFSVMALSQVGLAVPNFWFAILSILLFAVWLGWLPSGGFPGWNEGILVSLQALILPALALATGQAAILARMTRSSLLEVAEEDFMRTARAKGLTRRQALWRHGLRNALIPVVTLAGLQFGTLITGTIVVEQVFSLPGMGRLIFQAIANRDLPLVKSLVMLFAVAVILINFLVDLLYVWIDPRLRTGHG